VVSQKLDVTLILDLLHVAEKGNLGQVVKGLRQTVTKRKLFGAKRQTLLGAAEYFHRNRDRMRYDE
jgi:hypothetical protein